MRVRCRRDALSGVAMNFYFLARMRGKAVLSFAVRAGASVARKYLQGFDNTFNLDIGKNGEAWLVRQVVGRHPDGVYVDVGANLGNWTRTVLEAAPSSGVIAFEMVPECRELLHQAFDKDDRVTILECGLSSRAIETIAYRRPTSVPGGVLARIPEGIKEYVPTTVQLQRGDDVLSDVDNIALMKIDTDGHELDILNGLKQTIIRTQPIVQFEYSHFTVMHRVFLRDIYEFFAELDYVCGRLLPSSVAFSPYHKGDENFQNSNFVACPKGCEI